MKSLLRSALVSSLLLYGGLALLMWPKALKLMGVITYGPTWQPIFLIGGGLMAATGLALHLYQAEGDFRSVVKSYFFKLLIGVMIIVVMMATGLVATPPFLRNLW
jgi:hypothetical protein